jgi:hypothetical protein
LVFYLALFAFFTYPAPSNAHREAKGLLLQPRIAAILDETFTLDDAIEGEGYDPLRIWEPWTVHTMRVALLCTWLALFAAITMALANFVILQRKRQSTANN